MAMNLRMRRAFAYPEENDLPEEMDEEEQDKLVKALEQENYEKNQEWIRLFLGMTITMATLFLPTFYGCRTSGQKVTAAFGMTSLFITAYVLVLIPTKGRGKGPLLLTPMQQYTPLLNAILAGLVAWSGILKGHGFGIHQTYSLICCVPMAMFVVVMAARSFILEVDPEELEQLKYEFKGA